MRKTLRFGGSTLALGALIAGGSCKHAAVSGLQDADVSPPEAASDQGPAASFYEPYSLADSQISEADLIRQVQQIDPDFKGVGVTSTVLPHGERVLVVAEDNGRVTPLVSFDQGQLYEWWMSAAAQPVNGSDSQFEIQRHNLLVRVPAGGDPESPDNAWYAGYRRATGEVDLVPLAQHSITSTGILRRAGNDFYNENHERVFNMVPVAQDVWRLEGRFNSPYLCDGAVIWRAEPGYFGSVLTEFGQPTFFRWQAEGTTMRLVGEVEKPDDKAKAMVEKAHDCPYRTGDSLAQLLTMLDYSPETKFSGTADAAAQKPEKGVPPGGKVILDNAIWVVLSAQKRTVTVEADRTSSHHDVYDYVVTNYGRTFQEDGGRQYSRVYKYDGDTQQLELLGSSLWFLQSVPSMMADLSKQRVAAPKTIEGLQKEARIKLSLAETKAAEIDSPKKIGMVLGALAVNELVMASFKTPDSSFMGLKTVLGKDKDAAAGLRTFQAVSNVLRSSPEFKQRALAALYIVSVQSLVKAVDIVTTIGGKKPIAEVAGAVASSTAQTALGTGLLSLSPIVRNVDGVQMLQAGGVVASGLSGLALRWRKMSIEAAKGIDNGATWQHGLNYAAGTVTSVALTVVSFTYRNAGLNNAIVSGGVMVSDIISGRTSPGMIIGQTIESLSGLVSIGTLFGPEAAKVIPDPLIRPGAITAGKMANAYIQFKAATAFSSYVGEQIDAAIALKGRQLALADALRFMMKNNADLVGRLPRSDRNQLLATAQDPEAEVRAAFLSRQ